MKKLICILLVITMLCSTFAGLHITAAATALTTTSCMGHGPF